MKRNVLILGIAVLVVTCCIIAAGCTSESQNPAVDPVVGTWSLDFSKMTNTTADLFPSLSKMIDNTGDSIDDFLSLAKVMAEVESDGTGKVRVTIAGFSVSETDFTWVREDSGSYRMNLFDSDLTLNLDAASGILSDASGMVTLNKQA